MHSILAKIILVAAGLGAALHAAEGARGLSSLPASVYFITEPVSGGAPGQMTLYEVQRSGKKLGVVFSEKAGAEAFLAALPDAKDHARIATPVPQSFVADTLKMGAGVLLDPTNCTEGGFPVSADIAADDNPELKALCDADQSDRKPADGAIDWTVVSPRDIARIARVKTLYREGSLRTGSDYFRAALVLHHGATPEDYLLAHELAIVALKKNAPDMAVWLVAATEDRFLQSIGRAQRFGTQLTTPIVVDGLVTDQLRGELGVPSLPSDAKQAGH